MEERERERDDEEIGEVGRVKAEVKWLNGWRKKKKEEKSLREVDEKTRRKKMLSEIESSVVGGVEAEPNLQLCGVSCFEWFSDLKTFFASFWLIYSRSLCCSSRNPCDVTSIIQEISNSSPLRRNLSICVKHFQRWIFHSLTISSLNSRWRQHAKLTKKREKKVNKREEAEKLLRILKDFIMEALKVEKEETKREEGEDIFATSKPCFGRMMEETWNHHN